MFGALFQMLPVIAGVTLTSPIQKANLAQYPFVFGTTTLLLAFGLSTPWLFGLASLLLGVSILFIVSIMLKNLLSLPSHSSSSKGILIALLSLGAVILLALYLAATLAGVADGSYYTDSAEWARRQ